MTYDPREQEDIIEHLVEMMRPVLADGGRKRAAKAKPHWTVDAHDDSFHRHIHRWDLGERKDPDSGAHPMAHAGVRALMIAWQETYGTR